LKRYCLALDLVDDEALITEYEKYHEEIWPEIAQTIFDSGIVDMQIYSIENRLFMIIEAED
jgi:L-rhamnose mutarotase